MISVCITTFNGQNYIKQQLESVLCQLDISDEVVVSDDGSTDNTIAIVNAMHDARVKIIVGGNRLGVVKNFERALMNAKGNIIFLCDQDDVWLPNKVKQSVNSLREYMLVVTDCKVVDEHLHEVYPSFFAQRKSASGVCRNLYKNSYLGCCMAFRKELLSYALPMPVNVPMHDMWLGLLADIYGDVKFMPEALSLYRRHQENFSPTASKSTFGLLKMLQFRIVLTILLFSRIIRNACK